MIHRLLREGDPTFREELLNFSQRGRILQLSNFKDDSSPIGKSHFGVSASFVGICVRIKRGSYRVLTLIGIFCCFSLSLGLFSMGTYLCIIP